MSDTTRNASGAGGNGAGGGGGAGAAAASDANGRGGGDRHRCVVFVGNLPFSTPWQAIKDEFAKAGRVRYTDLVADKQGRPKGSALVTMSNPEGAAAAVKMFNETEFNGRRIIVREFNDGPRPTIVQKDLMPEYRRRDAGRNSALTQQQGGSGGNGGSQQGQQQQRRGGGNGGGDGAAAAQQGQQRGGRQQSQQKQQQPQQQKQQPQPRVGADGTRLFVSNLPFDCNATALRETFAQVGAVQHAEIITGRSGKSRGMGIVVMATPRLAEVAITEFHGIEMAGRPMHVRLDNNVGSPDGAAAGAGGGGGGGRK